MAGLAAKKREDWKAASERFSEAIDVDPDFIDAWTGRASARMQLQDYAAARHDYERALALDPYDSAPVTCLGILRVFDGQVEEGLAFVRDRSAPFLTSLAKMGSPVEGTLELSPLSGSLPMVQLDSAGQHRWRVIVPRGRVGAPQMKAKYPRSSGPSRP